MIDREKLLGMSGQFPEYEEVSLGELGSVRVKVMTVREKDQLDTAVIEKKYGFRPGLIALCTIDDRGIHVFDDDDIPKIEQLPMYIVEPIVNAAIKVNRLSKQDQEEIAKNLNGQAGVSLSA